MQPASRGQILKFCETLDLFIPIQYRSEGDIASQLSDMPTREHYIQTVVRSCIKDYERRVSNHARALIQAGDPLAGQLLEEEIFELCLHVNPQLALDKASLPQSTDEEPKIAAVSEQSSDLDASQMTHLEKILSNRVIGQREVVQAICQTLKRSLAGLRDSHRPLASFIFAGTTGVGKTEMAKAITEYLFGDSSYLLRVDGSEYALPHEAAKLTGAPPGYVGHEDGGFLTTQAAKLKRGVLLIDEIEKADSKVHNLLLQLIDEGHITDNQGNKVLFNNFIIILTTNTGVEEITSRRSAPGFQSKVMHALDTIERNNAALEGLKNSFSPEFLNRLDHIVVFNELDKTVCEEIIDSHLKKLEERCHDLGFELFVSNDLKKHLLNMSFDPQWGAREIKRQIQRIIEYPLSEKILGEDLKGNTVKADISNEQVTLSVHRRAA